MAAVASAPATPAAAPAAAPSPSWRRRRRAPSPLPAAPGGEQSGDESDDGSASDSNSSCDLSSDFSVGHSSGPPSPLCALDRNLAREFKELSAAAEPLKRTFFWALLLYCSVAWFPHVRETSQLLKWGLDLTDLFPASPADPASPRTLQQVATELFPVCVMMLLAKVPCWMLARRWWPDHQDPVAQMDLLFSMPFFPVLSWYACAGAWDLSASVDTRWHQSSARARHFLLLYVARMATHCLLQLAQKMDRGALVTMTFHHGTSIVCMGLGLITGNMHFWGCLDGACEITTVFLDNMYLMKELDGWKEGTAYAVNGVCLWASFLLFRVVLFPIWLWMWATDIRGSPVQTWDTVSDVERYMYPAVTVFILALSVMWFRKLTIGMLKALGVGAAPGARKVKGD